MNFLAQNTTAGGLFADEMASTNSSNLSMEMTSGGKLTHTRRADSKNTTTTVGMMAMDRNPFLTSIGESSLQEIEDQQINKEKAFKLNQRNIAEITKKFAEKRYGKLNDRMIVKYNDMTQQM